MIPNDNTTIFAKYWGDGKAIKKELKDIPPGYIYYCWIVDKDISLAGHEAVPFGSTSPVKLIEDTLKNAAGYVLRVYRYKFPIYVTVPVTLQGDLKIEVNLEIWLKPITDIANLDSKRIEEILTNLFLNSNEDVKLSGIRSMLEELIRRMQTVNRFREKVEKSEKIAIEDLVDVTYELRGRGLEIVDCHGSGFQMPKGPTIYIKEGDIDIPSDLNSP